MRDDTSPSKSSAGNAIGIDLGTTYSVVAYMDQDGRPKTILNDLGEILTPSALFFEGENIVVGREAIKASLADPGGFAECVKRDMGSPYYRHDVRGFQVPPEVLSGFLLERLRQFAEQHLESVRQAVITVPAFFDETRRMATQQASKLAGLEVLDIINEPTAAALAYGFGCDDEEEPRRVVIYDLGGGTFDVTILEIDGTLLRTIATDGDVQLGGKDFDERLVDFVADEFHRRNQCDPRSDVHDASHLWIQAEEAKHSLSHRVKTTVFCTHGGIRDRIEITREDFERITRDLLERTEVTASLVLKNARLDWTGIDMILLVGGSTRMPMVTDMLQRVSGITPRRSQFPDEIVAHGAATYARMLSESDAPSVLPPYEFVNVNSHSLGVVGLDQEMGHRVNKILIPRNTPLPCRAYGMFETAKSDQRSVIVPVVEGESRFPENCISLLLRRFVLGSDGLL